VRHRVAGSSLSCRRPPNPRVANAHGPRCPPHAKPRSFPSTRSVEQVRPANRGDLGWRADVGDVQTAGYWP
jgi:hypothetical protein